MKPLIVTGEKVNNYIHSSFIHKEMRVDVNCTNYDELGHSRAGAIEALVVDSKRDYPCYKPFREFTVYYSGEVYPCCNLLPDIDVEKKYLLGHILKNKSIFEIYNNKLTKAWRSSLFDYKVKKEPCEQCSDRECTLNNFDQPIREKIVKLLISSDENKIKF